MTLVKNKIRYLLLMAVVGLLTILYDQYIMGMILATAFALPALLFVILSYTSRRITANLLTTIHVVNKGEIIPVTVKLDNPTSFPISNLTICISYHNSYAKKRHKKEFHVSVDRKTNTTVICNMISEYTGSLQVSLNYIRIYDYVQLFSRKKKIHEENTIAVMPRLHEITESIILNSNKMFVESDQYSNVKGGDDPSEVFAIREYREGDRPQRIHWKLSVKQDQIMIKDFSEPLNCSILILANLNIPKGKNVLSFMDGLLESTLSLSYSLVLRGQMHYLSWFDKDQGVCKRIRVTNETDLYEALNGILYVQPYKEEADIIHNYHAEYPHDQYTDFFYITSNVSEAHLESMKVLRTMDCQIILVNDNNMCSEYEEQNMWDNDEKRVHEEMEKIVAEQGIGFLPIHIGRIKEDIERWKLG